MRLRKRDRTSKRRKTVIAMASHLTKGASKDMDYEEYQKRRKALKQKMRKWGAFSLALPNSRGEKYHIRIEELDKLYGGEEIEEWRLHGDFEDRPIFGYRFHYWLMQFSVFVLLGWWTLGLANLWYHRRFKKKWPKDQRI